MTENGGKEKLISLCSIVTFYYKPGLFINLTDECFCLIQQIQSRIIIPVSALRPYIFKHTQLILPHDNGCESLTLREHILRVFRNRRYLEGRYLGPRGRK
jgi:hypothetical protein